MNKNNVFIEMYAYYKICFLRSYVNKNDKKEN